MGDLVRKAYHVPERLVSVEASVQTLADGANRYGYWKEKQSQKQWIVFHWGCIEGV